MDILVQQVTGGLAIGCVYALIALGFTMMLRATELVNFAQGEFVMTGAYLGYTLLLVTPLPYLAVFVLASVGTGILGMLVERVALRPIRLKQSAVLNLIIATGGIGICLRLLAQLIWGAAPVRYARGIGQGEELLAAGLPVSVQHLWIIGLAAAAMLALHLFFQRTLPGIAWRAAAYDSATAEILGIGFSRVVTLTFGISATLAAGSPGWYEPEFIRDMKTTADYVMDNVPWYNPRGKMYKEVNAAFAKKYPGNYIDTNSGYAYLGVLVIADALERAKSTKPEDIVAALKNTYLKQDLMVGLAVAFDERGDNIYADTAMIQILGGLIKVVLPEKAAEENYVYPMPWQLWERGR